MTLLTLSNISKRYGTTVALSEVSFELGQGEVHALLGENGAGKSTLLKIAYGLEQADSGTITVRGQDQRFAWPRDARAAGIGMVHQHFTSIPSFTVAENIALAAGWPVSSPAKLAAQVETLGERLGLPLDPSLPTASLSVGLKQRLELLMALASDARILLLDEPTSVLAPPEADALLGMICELRGKGIAVVLITHKLEEALAVADRVTVLRRGMVVLSELVGAVDRERLVNAMIGGSAVARLGGPQVASGTGDTDKNTDFTDLKDDYPDKASVQSVSLVVDRIGATGSGLRSASFTVRAGEIVGVAAVEGSGQRELFRALAGLASPSAGSLEVKGRVSFVPEDRSSEGMIGEFTLTENLALMMGAEAPWVRGLWLDWDAVRARTTELVGEFDVRTGSADSGASAGVWRTGGPPSVLMASLSGGNQQKLIVAAALERRPTVLLAENPTRGLDIKASADLLWRLREAASHGIAVLVYLPDLDDLLPLVDRVVVLNNGVLTEMAVGADRAAIGAAMVQ